MWISEPKENFCFYGKKRLYLIFCNKICTENDMIDIGGIKGPSSIIGS